MPIDLSKAFEVRPESGIVFTDAEGVQRTALVGGSGSPDGQQAPISSIYFDFANGDFWQKVGPDTDISETGWQKNGQSFANAADFESFRDDDTDTTTDPTYQNKLTALTGAKEGGRYNLGWFFEIGHSKKDNLFRARVQINDGATVVTSYEATLSVSSANIFVPIAGFDILPGLAPAVDPNGYTITVDFSENGTGTARIKNVNVIIYRIGD